MRKRWRVVVALVIALVWMTPYSHATAQEPPAEEEVGLVRDAAMYAKDVGVSHAEAIRRLKLDRIAGKLNEALEAKEADALGGLWLVHEPEFRVVVALKGAGPERIRPYIAGGPLEGIVEVRSVTATLRQLQATQSQAIRTLGELGIRFNSGVNVQANRVEVEVTNPAQLQSVMEVARVRLPERVGVLKVDTLGGPAADIWAGWKLNEPNGDVECTSGFSVLNGSGTQGISTAGHCENNLILWDGTALPWKNSWYVRDQPYDLQWMTTPGYDPVAYVPDSDGISTKRPVWGLRYNTQINIDSYVCKYGRMTEYGCGWVRQKNFVGFGPSGTDLTATFVRVKRGNDDLATPGDSGGPWYQGNYAVGIMHGYTGGTTYSEGLYMPIDYLVDKGLGVLICDANYRQDC
jgi:hypothetical protein